MKLLPNGIYVLENDTHISKWVEESGRLDHDRYALPIIQPYIKKGDTVVDAGAFIGDHTIAYLDSVGPEGTVHAFEPNPRAFECLSHNCPSAKCYNLALSDSTSTFGFTPSENAGASHLVDKIEGDGVRTMALDWMLLPRLDFLKLDVEGFEFRTLLGGRETILRHHPVMWIEVNPGALARAGTSVDQLKGILSELKYRWLGYPDEISDQYDLLCIPR